MYRGTFYEGVFKETKNSAGKHHQTRCLTPQAVSFVTASIWRSFFFLCARLQSKDVTWPLLTLAAQRH